MAIVFRESARVIHDTRAIHDSRYRPLAERIIAELGEGFAPKMNPADLTVKMVSRLTQMLKDVKRFKPPDGGCLSPAGEYNLRCASLN